MENLEPRKMGAGIQLVISGQRTTMDGQLLRDILEEPLISVRFTQTLISRTENTEYCSKTIRVLLISTVNTQRVLLRVK